VRDELIKKNLSFLFVVYAAKPGMSLTPNLQNAPRRGITLPEVAKMTVSNSIDLPSTSAAPMTEDTGMSVEPNENTPSYKCSLSLSNIHVIDTPEKIDLFLEYLEATESAQESTPNPSVLVGFDAEWKPMLGEDGVALIQIATLEEVFLIDTFQLKRNPGDPDRMVLLLEKFFKNEVSTVKLL
jgi:hypothetical protein